MGVVSLSFVSMNYLETIARLTESNMGGLVTLEVIKASHVVSLPDAVNGVIYGDIVLAEGTGFVTWYGTDETLNIRSSIKEAVEGTVANNRLPFIISKDRPEIKYMLDNAREDEFIVKYTDANGQVKLFGTPESPLKFQYDHGSGAERSDKNGYECEFYYEGPNNIYFYEGNSPAPPSSSQLTIVKVNGVTKASGVGNVVNIITEFEPDDFEISYNIT